MRTEQNALTNSVVLVTGSSRGIGRAIAAELIERGAVVAVHGRELARVEEACGELHPQRAKAFAADLDDPQSARTLVREVIERCGDLHGLVNNAGGGHTVAFRGLDIARWRETLRVNLEAAFVASREAYDHMRKARRGSIVNIASLAAHGPGRWMGADYAASKAGLVSLTQSLALEFAGEGVRINAICPGVIQTGLWDEAMWSGYARKCKLDPSGVKEAVVGKIPLGRLGTAEDVAGVALFLASESSSYLTGQAINVNGGALMS